MQLLIVEDNPDLVENLTEFFDARGHGVDVAYNGPAGLGFAIANDYDVIILDLMLPGMDGLEVCTRLRAEGHYTPVLMLTARDTLRNKLDGFSSGADDYLVKPFALPELEARVTALARRRPNEIRADRLRVHDLSFDITSLEIRRGGRRIDLPPIPLKILALLMRRSPGVVSRAEIEREIWADSPPDSDTLRAHLHTLRGAIDHDFDTPLLHTVRRMGYKLAHVQD
ncbi:MAG: response regulator transcription factor [Gammaproteobacteria bacterium]